MYNSKVVLQTETFVHCNSQERCQSES